MGFFSLPPRALPSWARIGPARPSNAPALAKSIQAAKETKEPKELKEGAKDDTK